MFFKPKEFENSGFAFWCEFPCPSFPQKQIQIQRSVDGKRLMRHFQSETSVFKSVSGVVSNSVEVKGKSYAIFD